MNPEPTNDEPILSTVAFDAALVAVSPEAEPVTLQLSACVNGVSMKGTARLREDSASRKIVKKRNLNDKDKAAVHGKDRLDVIDSTDCLATLDGLRESFAKMSEGDAVALEVAEEPLVSALFGDLLAHQDRVAKRNEAVRAKRRALSDHGLVDEIDSPIVYRRFRERVAKLVALELDKVRIRVEATVRAEAEVEFKRLQELVVERRDDAAKYVLLRQENSRLNTALQRLKTRLALYESPLGWRAAVVRLLYPKASARSVNNAPQAAKVLDGGRNRLPGAHPGAPLQPPGRQPGSAQ